MKQFLLFVLPPIMAACGPGDDPSDARKLAFTRVEKEDSELFLSVAQDDSFGAHELDLSSDDEEGVATKGELSDAQVALIESLLTDQLLKEYEADADPDCSTEPAQRYYLQPFELSTEGLCFSTGDPVSSSTQTMLDQLTKLTESLVAE